MLKSLPVSSLLLGNSVDPRSILFDPLLCFFLLRQTNKENEPITSKTNDDAARRYKINRWVLLVPLCVGCLLGFSVKKMNTIK